MYNTQYGCTMYEYYVNNITVLCNLYKNYVYVYQDSVCFSVNLFWWIAFYILKKTTNTYESVHLSVWEILLNEAVSNHWELSLNSGKCKHHELEQNLFHFSVQWYINYN